MSDLRCLEYNVGTVTCKGPVEMRFSMSPSGRSFPRCQKHYENRLAKQEKIVSRYGGQIFY